MAALTGGRTAAASSGSEGWVGLARRRSIPRRARSALGGVARPVGYGEGVPWVVVLRFVALALPGGCAPLAPAGCSALTSKCAASVRRAELVPPEKKERSLLRVESAASVRRAERCLPEDARRRGRANARSVRRRRVGRNGGVVPPVASATPALHRPHRRRHQAFRRSRVFVLDQVQTAWLSPNPFQQGISAL